MENPIFSSADQAPHSCSNAQWYHWCAFFGGLKHLFTRNVFCWWWAMSSSYFVLCYCTMFLFFCHQMHRICVNIFLESNLWRWLMVDKNHVTNQTFPILSICGSCLQSINQKSPGSGFVTNNLFHSSSRIRPLKIQFVRGKIGGDAKQFMKR